MDGLYQGAECIHYIFLHGIHSPCQLAGWIHLIVLLVGMQTQSWLQQHAVIKFETEGQLSNRDLAFMHQTVSTAGDTVTRYHWWAVRMQCQWYPVVYSAFYSSYPSSFPSLPPLSACLRLTEHLCDRISCFTADVWAGGLRVWAV